MKDARQALPNRPTRLATAGLIGGLSIAIGMLVDYQPTSMLILVGAALAVAWWPGRLLEGSHRCALLGALATIMLVSGIKDDVSELLDGKVRVWNVYHYYLGAKYFPELGYNDLYLATLAADREGANYWTDVVDKVRSLETYKVAKVTPENLAYDPQAHFSTERWASFKADVEALAHYRSAKSWRNVFRDRGYNGTPLWTTIGRVLTEWIPASSPALLLLALLDLALLTCTGLLVLRTFGGFRSVLILLLFSASPTNVARLVGGFLQTDWLCALVAGVCFLQRRRPVLAGLLFAYAILTRAFPILLVGCGAIAVLAEWWRRGDRDFSALRRRSTFYLALAIASFAGFVVGTLGNGRGIDGWVEFKQAISVHRTIHVIGDRRIGLEHFFTQDLADLGDHVNDRRRAELLSSNRPLYLLSAGLLLALLAAVVVRRPDQGNAILLGTVAVFAILTLSRYYFGILALLPLLSLTPNSYRKTVTGTTSIVTGIVVGGQLLAFAAYYRMVQQGAELHNAYAIFNGLLAVYFLVILGRLLVIGPDAAVCASEKLSVT